MSGEKAMMRMRGIVAAVCAAASICGSASIAAAQQGDVVYTSLLTGLRSGVTDIYSIGANGATLTGRLDKGGGGPVAVDGQGDVYVIEANYDGNLFQQSTPVYVFAPGSRRPIRRFVAHGFGAQAMAIGADGTVYMAGPLYPDVNTYRVLKFAPGATRPTYLPIDHHDPTFPMGMAIDAGGDLLVGWLDGGTCQIADLVGCVDELAAGDSAWRVRLSPASAANDLDGGPLIAPDGQLVIHSSGLAFSYISTIPVSGIAPSAVIQLPVGLFGGQTALAFDGSGSTLWGLVTGLASDDMVHSVAYPSGAVGLSFPVTAPHNEPFFAIGLAVSPPDIPSMFRRAQRRPSDHSSST